MQDIVAGISDIVLDIEYQLKNQIGCQPLPFPGMDSKYTDKHGLKLIPYSYNRLYNQRDLLKFQTSGFLACFLHRLCQYKFDRN